MSVATWNVIAYSLLGIQIAGAIFFLILLSRLSSEEHLKKYGRGLLFQSVVPYSGGWRSKIAPSDMNLVLKWRKSVTSLVVFAIGTMLLQVTFFIWMIFLPAR